MKITLVAKKDVEENVIENQTSAKPKFVHLHNNIRIPIQIHTREQTRIAQLHNYLTRNFQLKM